MGKDWITYVRILKGLREIAERIRSLQDGELQRQLVMTEIRIHHRVLTNHKRNA